MTHQLALECLRRQYLWLESHFNELFEVCQTDQERDSLRRAYVSSRDNLWESRGRIFIDHDPAARDIVEELGRVQSRLEWMLESGAAPGIVEQISASVNLACRLVTAGSAP